MLKLFAGYDARESVGYHVFCDSVLEHTTQPVSITALDSKGLPVGTNAFTFSRFLVPWLCEFRGHAIFMDGADMLMRADVVEMDALFDPAFACQVVKHPNYQTRHPRKYVGTTMEAPNSSYRRKNWASAVIFNCAHPAWLDMTPDVIGSSSAMALLQFASLHEDEIGALPDCWNRLVDEGHPVDDAKVVHFTAGIPAWPAYANAPGAGLWFAARDRMLESA